MNKQKIQPKSILDLKELVTYYKNNVSDDNVQIDIMFVKKTTSKKSPYKTWMLLCRNEDVEEMLKDTLSNMETIVSERTIDNYDLELSTDDTIQVIEKEKVINYPKLMESVTVEYTDKNIMNENTDYNKLDFVVIKISDGNVEQPRPSITILKRHFKATSKFTGSKRFVFNGEEAVAFNKPLLLIGSNVEAFNVEDFFYVINRDAFNNILNFKDVYYKIVSDNTEQIKQAGLFDDVDSFIAECCNNGRYITRLTKAILAEGFKNVKNNKNKLYEIKTNYNLNFKFTDDGKIVYNKEHVSEILNLLLEHYVTSALTDKRMLAKAIEKYE